MRPNPALHADVPRAALRAGSRAAGELNRWASSGSALMLLLSSPHVLQQKGNNAMKLRIAPALVTIALLWCGLASSHAIAQTANDLVGIWSPVSAVNTRPDGSTVYPFGPDPKGILVFASNGHFAFILNRPDLPKFAANNRNMGTADENKAIVQGSFAYFGTYSVANKVVTMHVEGGTWPSWTGTHLERLILSFSGDDMKWTDPTPSVGGKIENTWRRTK